MTWFLRIRLYKIIVSSVNNIIQTKSSTSHSVTDNFINLTNCSLVSCFSFRWWATFWCLPIIFFQLFVNRNEGGRKSTSPRCLLNLSIFIWLTWRYLNTFILTILIEHWNRFLCQVPLTLHSKMELFEWFAIQKFCKDCVQTWLDSSQTNLICYLGRDSFDFAKKNFFLSLAHSLSLFFSLFLCLSLSLIFLKTLSIQALPKRNDNNNNNKNEHTISEIPCFSQLSIH